MFQIGTEENYRDGEIIFEEGSSGDWIYVIESGAVEIFGEIDGEKMVFAVLKPGEVIGEMGFITKEVRSASARAVGDTTVGIIDRDFLDFEFNKLSSSFQAILITLARRLKEATRNADLIKKAPRGTKVLSLAFKTRDHVRRAFSENMDGNGLFIRTSNPLAKGERFFLKLRLPDIPEPAKIGCEVTSSRADTDDPSKKPLGMEIRFIQISESDRQAILRFLK